MRLLVVHCHPVPDSFGAALCDTVVTAARSAGHAVDLLDLYAEGFDPVMSDQERRDYHTAGVNEAPVRDHVARLRACEGLILTYPTWWMGPPAMLKGWLDRVWLPHVVFTMAKKPADMRPLLTKIRHIGAVSTLGAPWWYWTFVLGDPGRRVLLRSLRGTCHPRCRTFWLGLHGMDSCSEADRRRFLEKVARRISRLH